MIRKYFLIVLITCFSLSLLAQCPRNSINCNYGCGLCVDIDSNGYCDNSILTDDVLLLLKQKSDSARIHPLENNISKSKNVLINREEKKSPVVKQDNKIQIVQKDTVIQKPLNSTSLAKGKELIKNKYDLVGTGSIVLLLYASTFILARRKRIKMLTHRKIWNVALLIAFLCSGLMGLLLVAQIEYSILLPNLYLTLLYWHVEFGIAMALIGVFHVVWHLNYFKNFFKQSKKRK